MHRQEIWGKRVEERNAADGRPAGSRTRDSLLRALMRPNRSAVRSHQLARPCIRVERVIYRVQYHILVNAGGKKAAVKVERHGPRELIWSEFILSCSGEEEDKWLADCHWLCWSFDWDMVRFEKVTSELSDLQQELASFSQFVISYPCGLLQASCIFYHFIWDVLLQMKPYGNLWSEKGLQLRAGSLLSPPSASYFLKNTCDPWIRLFVFSIPLVNTKQTPAACLLSAKTGNGGHS